MIVADWWVSSERDLQTVPVAVEADGAQVVVHINPSRPDVKTLTISPDDSWRFIKEFTRALVAAEKSERGIT